MINTNSFGRFWPISWIITHRFGVLERFSWLLNPNVRLRVGHQHLQFWPIMARFVDYYSPFLGPGAIFLVDVPQCALMCMTLTLTDLANSGLFRGLLLTVLGSRSDFLD